MAPYASPLRNTQKLRVPQSMDVQDPTLRFFLEGDELEAETRRASLERSRGFENDNGGRDSRTRDTLILQDRDLGSLNPYDRFENHARTRGALIAMALLTSVGAMGVAGWMWMTSPTRPGLDWFQRRAIPAVTAFTSRFAPAPEAPSVNHPPEVAPEVAAAPTPEPAAPVAAQAPTSLSQTAPVVEPIVSDNDVAPAAAAAASAAPAVEDPAPARPAARANSATTSSEGRALRGYVWSPAARTLVTSNEAPAAAAPATPPAGEAPSTGATKNEAAAAEPPVAPANPDAPMPSSLLSGPGIAPPTTGPAPDETARVPTTEPAPFPSPSVTDGKASPPIIE